MPWKLIVGSMQDRTIGTGTTAGSRVVAEAMLSVEMDCARSDLIAGFDSVAPKSVRAVKLMLWMLGG